MMNGHSPFTERLLERVRADERVLASRRSTVLRGFAASVVVLGLLILARDGFEPGTSVDPNAASTYESDRAGWIAQLGSDREQSRTALRQLLLLFVEQGDEPARVACADYLEARARGGEVDLFGLLVHSATKDKARTLERARVVLASRSVHVAALDEDWDALLDDVTQLSDEDEIWAVLFYLESFSGTDAAPYVPWVATQMGHSSDVVRARSLQTLRRLAPEGIEAQLIPVLQTGTPFEKQRALMIAKDLGLVTETTTAILGALGDADPAVRMFAAETLASFGDASNAAAVAALVSDVEVQVRVSAAFAAAQLGDTQYVGSMVPVANGTIPAGATHTLPGLPEAHAMNHLATLGDGRGADAAELHIADFVAGTTGSQLVVCSLLVLEQLQRVSAIPLVQSIETVGQDSLWIQAGATLHALGSPVGSAVLNQYFNSDSEAWRTQAIMAAGRLEDEVFRDDFEDLQNHSSQTTRDSADGAIDRLDESAGGN